MKAIILTMALSLALPILSAAAAISYQLIMLIWELSWISGYEPWIWY